MIVLINPNSTEAMTEGMLATAGAAVPGLPLLGWTSTDGPPAIQGAADGAAAVPPMLEKVAEARAAGAAAIIIGCFDDTGLAEARDIAGCPVIGIGEAAYHLAAMVGRRFSVVTTLPISIPILEANVAAYGLADRCARVRASGVAVLALEEDPDRAADQVLAEIAEAEREDDIDCVALGCGGMSRLPALVRERTGLTPIDGVTAAVAAAAALI